MTGRMLWLAIAAIAVTREPVQIRGFQFQPAELTVQAGDRVTWTNADDITHTVTSGAPDSLDRRFDGALETGGAAWSHAFATPGTYPYHCARHPFMRGVVRVLPKGR
jgi:amicyanin